MFDTVMGLPVHILVLHFVVVVAPVAALTAIAYAARPAWRPMLWKPLAALALATGVFGLVTGESGEALERRVLATETDQAAIALLHDHTEAGDLAKVLCLLFMVVVLVAIWLLVPRTGEGRFGKAGALVGVVAIVLASLATIGSVTVTGHSGAKASWSEVGAQPAPTHGGGDN